MVKLKIYTCNMRGLSNYNKRRDFFHMLRKNEVDIVMLQETHSDKMIEKIWNTQWGTKIWYSHGTSNSRGVANLFFEKNTSGSP